MRRLDQSLQVSWDEQRHVILIRGIFILNVNVHNILLVLVIIAVYLFFAHTMLSTKYQSCLKHYSFLEIFIRYKVRKKKSKRLNCVKLMSTIFSALNMYKSIHYFMP